jgi:5-deoxy-D-glucuronate isomerase
VPRQTVPGGWRSPVQAVQVFAATYINWSAATVSARLQALADVSVGQARSAMSLAASETAHDRELHRGGVANSGVVEAIAPVRSRARQYAVVTRELTTAANSSAYRGLAPAWHVSLATVTQVPGGLWVLSAWQPEN